MIPIAHGEQKNGLIPLQTVLGAKHSGVRKLAQAVNRCVLEGLVEAVAREMTAPQH
jgi:hypothetical protein